jgi:SAM-dependent methyltransferase
MAQQGITDAVKARYGRAARGVKDGAAASACCGDSPSTSLGTGCGCGGDPITSNLYDARQTSDLPAAAVAASLGCGNPTALIQLHDGEVVLDLGSGGGIDVLLSARRVGPTGKVYGLDMTDEMLALARENQVSANARNVEFLKGQIEAIPLPDASVDVIISNCVINLSPDKDRVLAEAFRVLKPGGRFAVSDVVVLGEVSPELRRNMELWVGCVAGALRPSDYRSKLTAAGFVKAEVELWRIYSSADASPYLAQAGLAPDSIREADGRFASAFIRATKPESAKSCCGPDCCA